MINSITFCNSFNEDGIGSEFVSYFELEDIFNPFLWTVQTMNKQIELLLASLQRLKIFVRILSVIETKKIGWDNLEISKM